MYFKEPFDKEKIVKQHEELLNIFKEDLSNLSDKTIKNIYKMLISLSMNIY